MGPEQVKKGNQKESQKKTQELHSGHTSPLVFNLEVKGAPQKCTDTDHSIASMRQQAHTRKRVPTALPRTCEGLN
jgi:hypothetical protein